MPSGAIHPHRQMPSQPPVKSKQLQSPPCTSWRTYPLNPRDLHRLTRVGGPTEIAFHAVQTGVSLFALCSIISTINFQLIDGYFSPTAWFLLLACLFSITTAIGYGLLAWWARTAGVQEEIKMSVRLAHAAAIEAAHVQAQVQAHAAQGDTRASSNSLWSLAEKSNSPTSSNNTAQTPDRRSKILQISAFVLCPLPRVCILLGLVALTLLASILQGYRIRKGTRCSLYDEPLRGFCRSTKNAVGAVFLESLLWLCWFAFWFFVSFHKTPGPDEMEIEIDGSSVVRMGLSQHSAAITAGNVSGGEGRRGDSDLELTMMPTVLAQQNQAGSDYSPVTPSPVAAVRWHDSRPGDLDENQQQSHLPPTPPPHLSEKGSQQSTCESPFSSPSLASSSSSTSSTLHPDGRTMQQQQQQPDRRQPSSTVTIGTEVLTPSARARKAHPSALPRINTASADQKVAAKFEGPRTRGSHHSGPPSTSSVSSFSVRMPDASRTISFHHSNRNSILISAPAIISLQSNRMSRSYSADIPLNSSNSQGLCSATSPSSAMPITFIARPRSISLGPLGAKVAVSLLRPPPCPLPSAINNNNNNSNNTTGNKCSKDVGGKFGRNRPNSSEFVLLSLEDQQKVDLYWEGQLPYPPPPPLSPTSLPVGAFFADLEDSEKEKVLAGNRMSIQLRPAQM